MVISPRFLVSLARFGDFAALSRATNFAKTLAKVGCEHVAELKRKKDYKSPVALGEASKAVSTTVRRFVEHFWCKFGRQDTKALAETHCAEVCVSLLLFLLYRLHFCSCCYGLLVCFFRI